MTKYRKKPIVIEAIQWTGDNFPEICDFGRRFRGIDREPFGLALLIETLEGTMKANLNDWIIKGVQGEVYPIKNDIFLETYEKVID